MVKCFEAEVVWDWCLGFESLKMKTVFLFETLVTAQNKTILNETFLIKTSEHYITISVCSWISCGDVNTEWIIYKIEYCIPITG